MRFEFTDGELARDIEALRCGDRSYNLLGHKVQLDRLRFNQLFTSMVSYSIDDWAERLLFHQSQYKRAVETVNGIVRKSQQGTDIYGIFHELRDLSGQGKGLETQERQYEEMLKIMDPMGRSYRGVGLDMIKTHTPTCLGRVEDGISYLTRERSNVYYSIAGALRDNLAFLGASFEKDRPQRDSDRFPLWRLLSPHRL